MKSDRQLLNIIKKGLNSINENEHYNVLSIFIDKSKLSKEELDELKEVLLETEEDYDPGSLQNAFNNFCFECGNGQDYVIEYVQQHDNEPQKLLEEAKHLIDNRKQNLLDILLSSDYDIFVPWYKAFLEYCKGLGKKDICASSTATDILNLYKDSFDEVENL